MRPWIVKVGGSLYQLPDLATRLATWLRTLDAPRVVLVPGGGAAADVIRHYDRLHRLGDEAAHWLALRMLTVNAAILQGLLPQAVITATPLTEERLAILDMHAFARGDDRLPGRLPHCWEVTSDSLAVRVAQVSKASRLTMLKSIAWEGDDWSAAAAAGIVDPFFPEALKHCPDLRVETVNFRGG